MGKLDLVLKAKTLKQTDITQELDGLFRVMNNQLHYCKYVANKVTKEVNLCGIKSTIQVVVENGAKDYTLTFNSGDCTIVIYSCVDFLAKAREAFELEVNAYIKKLGNT